MRDRGKGESDRRGRPLAAALLLLVLGLTLGNLLTWRQDRANDVRIAHELDTLAQAATRNLVQRFHRYEYGLRGMRGSILTGGRDNITRRQIRAYADSRDIDVEFPGARGFGFIRRVPVEHETAFLARTRRDDAPEFALRQLQASDRERYVIEYIEPLARNRPALGLDIASEALRRTAADLALRTGQVAITRPITLLQAPGEHQQGFLILLPVYQPGMPLNSESDREAAAFGWTYAPLVIAEVLQGFDLRGGEFTVSLFDEGEQFYGATEPPDDPLLRRVDQPLFGRTWQIELRAQPAFVARLNLIRPATVFVAGTLLSALLAALLYAYLQSRQRKRQLLAGQLHLATIIENSSDAIISETLGGIITSWNRAAERIFGYRADEAIGRVSTALIPAVTSDRNGESMLMSVRHGGAIEPFDQVCRHRDGSRVEVSITASPITTPDGQVIGMGKTIRDIGTRKQAERQLQEFNATLEHLVRERTAQLETTSRDLQTILDALPSMIGYWDARQTCRLANSAYHKWFGVEPRSLPGRHIRDLLGESLYAANRPHIEAALRGEPQTFERSIPRPQGGVSHALAHYLPDVVAGEVRGFYVMVHDVSDITESRQKLAAAIREHEALLRTIQSNVLYSVTDRSGIILDVNEVLCRNSGYRRDELIGHNHRILGSGTHGREFWADMWATIGTGRPWRGELCDRAKDGSLFWSDTVIAPFFSDNGVIERFVAIGTDITARKTAARQLAHERERLDNILRGTHAGTWEWNVQTGETRFNARWAEHIGHTLDELAPLTLATWHAHIHPEDLVVANELLRRHFSGELDQYECELRVRHRDGHWVWVVDRGRVSTWTADGAPEWMYGTQQDISRRKEALRLLAASEVFLERAGQLAKVGGWQLEVDSGELTWTSETRRLLEVPADYLPVLDQAVAFYTPEARPVLVAALRRTMTEGGSFDLDLPLITATGRSLWVRAIGEAEYITEGARSRPVRLIGAIQDITAQRAADDALRAAKGAAEAANAAKSVFLANMSHEIRTPLNAIIGLTYLLDRSTLSDEQRRFIATLQIAGRELLGIVNDVLDLAKIEAGNIVLDVAPFSLRGLLDDLLAVFEPQARARHLALTFDLPDDLPHVVHGDSMRVRQLLTNLLGNAIKFTERGSVRLHVALTRDPADRLLACFTVHDTGIGISAEAQRRIFTPFEQADASTTRRFGGTGLGLSIVRQVVGLMGGEVSVRSALGEGSEFRLVLPLGLPAPRADDPGQTPAQALVEPSARLADIRILVVDDSEFNREIAQCILINEGAIVTTHSDGQQAIEQLRATPDAFDIVLMDVQMPRMDGNEATSRIRGELGLNDLPVIALTAGALLAERQRALDAGMSDFVSKPLDPDTLVRLVRRHIDERYPGRRHPAAAPPPTAA